MPMTASTPEVLGEGEGARARAMDSMDDLSKVFDTLEQSPHGGTTHKVGLTSNLFDFLTG